MWNVQGGLCGRCIRHHPPLAGLVIGATWAVWCGAGHLKPARQRYLVDQADCRVSAKPVLGHQYHCADPPLMCGHTRTVSLWSPPVLNPPVVIQQTVSINRSQQELKCTGFLHSFHIRIRLILGVLGRVFKTMVCWTLVKHSVSNGHVRRA